MKYTFSFKSIQTQKLAAMTLTNRFLRVHFLQLYRCCLLILNQLNNLYLPVLDQSGLACHTSHTFVNIQNNTLFPDHKMETENEGGVIEVIQNQNDGESGKNFTRTSAPLNHICGVCGALAPDHLHFGGSFILPLKLFST